MAANSRVGNSAVYRMRSACRLASITLTTGRTAVGPLARVPHTVLHQLPLHVEGLPTFITGEHFVSRVCLFVLLQIAEIAEP